LPLGGHWRANPALAPVGSKAEADQRWLIKAFEEPPTVGMICHQIGQSWIAAAASLAGLLAPTPPPAGWRILVTPGVTRIRHLLRASRLCDEFVLAGGKSVPTRTLFRPRDAPGGFSVSA
jgi:hypothetical protein